MLRTFYFLLSALLLMVSFAGAKSKWAVGGLDLYGILFFICIVVYFPLMVVSFCFFVSSLVVLYRTRCLQRTLSPLVASATGAVALYRFNYWVFNDVY
ncbi:hypothetical protein [Pseudomonas sp. NPDC089534]|uniref:hypothetical protein n=1 Tax=Pseudomonas sp. NPDC089534 TaxID=3364468 RepID=UPI00381AA286